MSSILHQGRGGRQAVTRVPALPDRHHASQPSRIKGLSSDHYSATKLGPSFDDALRPTQRVRISCPTLASNWSDHFSGQLVKRPTLGWTLAQTLARKNPCQTIPLSNLSNMDNILNIIAVSRDKDISRHYPDHSYSFLGSTLANVDHVGHSYRTPGRFQSDFRSVIHLASAHLIGIHSPPPRATVASLRSRFRELSRRRVYRR